MERQTSNESAPDRAAKLRAFFASYIARRGAVKDPRIEAAFAAVPREPFAGSGPWSVLVAGQWDTSCTSPNYWPWASAHARSGTVEGLPAADAIYVNAGVTQPNWAWLEALRPGARLLFPLQAVDNSGGMLLLEKPLNGGLGWPARFVSRAAFIACETHQDKAMGRALSAAFASGGWRSVRSMRLDNTPDGTCWVDGGDWWLSTGAVEYR